MIILNGGGKGGPGKSMISMLALDHHIQHDPVPPILVETDTSNPDVLETYAKDLDTVDKTHEGKGCTIYKFNLSDSSSRIALGKMLLETQKHDPAPTVIINTGARNQDEIAAFASALRHLPLTTLWAICREFSSVNLLKRYLDIVPNTRVCVIKNGLYGSDDDYITFNESNTGKRVPAVLLPKAEPVVTDYMYTKQCVPADLEKTMELPEWWETEDWLKTARETYAEAIQIARVADSVNNAVMPELEDA